MDSSPPEVTNHTEVSDKAVKRTFPIITWLTCVACVAVFLGLLSSASNEAPGAVSEWGYYQPYDVLRGAYWAFITSVFVHFEWWHLAFNVYWLYVCGVAIERQQGLVRYAAFFLGAGLFSSLAEFFFTGDTGIGASGVAYALFGYMWFKRREVREFAEIMTPKLVRWFIFWLIGCVVATLANVWNVGNAAHISGLLFGAAIAARTLFKRKKALIDAGLAFAAIALMISLFWAPWSHTWTSHKAMQAHEKGDIAAATAWYKRSLELGQDRAWCLANLAELYAWNGQKAEFKETIEALRSIDPDQAKAVEEQGFKASDASDAEEGKENQ